MAEGCRPQDRPLGTARCGHSGRSDHRGRWLGRLQRSGHSRILRRKEPVVETDCISAPDRKTLALFVSDLHKLVSKVCPKEGISNKSQVTPYFPPHRGDVKACLCMYQFIRSKFRLKYHNASRSLSKCARGDIVLARQPKKILTM